MSKVTASSDIDNVKPEEVARFVDIALQDIIATVNGKLDFAANFNAKEVTVIFTAANTDTAAVHGLGRVATRYILTSSNVALNVIYTGAAAGTSSTMYLKSSVVGTATILIY